MSDPLQNPSIEPVPHSPAMVTESHESPNPIVASWAIGWADRFRAPREDPLLAAVALPNQEPQVTS